MTVDGLTDIFNRRYFDTAIEREFSRALRYERLCRSYFLTSIIQAHQRTRTGISSATAFCGRSFRQ